MEDLNKLCGDCVVISCCCQCLILQILIFVLLRLPCKIVKKTRRYAKRKFQKKKKRCENVVHREIGEYGGEFVRIHGQHSFRISREEREFIDGRNSSGCCMKEVEKVMEELYQNGEFSFGSFWGRKGQWDLPNSIENNDNNDDDSVVRYQVIEMINSVRCK